MSDEDGQSEREKERREDRAWEQAKRRDEMAIHGLRSVLFLNGGGTVALLAFLQAVWVVKDAAGLVPWVVAGMIPLMLGAAASGWVHFMRYETTEAYQMVGREEGRKFTRRHKRVTAFAFVMFLVGMGIVVGGAFFNLPQASDNVGAAMATPSSQLP